MQKATAVSPFTGGSQIEAPPNTHRSSRKGSSLVQQLATLHLFSKKAEEAPAVLKICPPVQEVPTATCKEEQLLEALETKASNVIEGLLITNESIIDTKELFELVLGRVQYLLKEKQSGSSLVRLFEFACSWLEKNRLTTLFQKAKIPLETLCTLGKGCPYLKVKAIAEKLEVLLIHEPQKNVPALCAISVKPKFLKFSAILDDLRETRLMHCYDEIVSHVSWDLTLHEWRLLVAVTPNDFFKSKWGHSSAGGLARYIQFQNDFGDFIGAKIRQEEDQEKKARLVKFFINIAMTCLEHSDYSTSFVIYQAINSTKILDRIEGDSYAKAMKRLNLLFQAGGSNYPQLRQELQKCALQFHIPYVPVYQKDIEMYETANPETVTMGAIRLFNFAKLRELQGYIDKALLVQRIPFPKERHFHTDLISDIDQIGKGQ